VHVDVLVLVLVDVIGERFRPRARARDTCTSTSTSTSAGQEPAAGSTWRPRWWSSTRPLLLGLTIFLVLACVVVVRLDAARHLARGV